MSYALIECEKKKFFRFTSIDEVFEQVHIKLPQFNSKKSKKYGKKINRILKKYKVSNVVLSKDLLQNEIIKNIIYMQNNYIITGNKLYEALIKKSIFDMCNIAAVPVQTMKVTIFAHEFSIENLNLVKYISKDVKQVIVVSENKVRFENLLNDLMEKEGIVIELHDNAYKNSLRCDFVINIDFNENELKKYNFSREAIVISVKEKISGLRMNFNGIIINDFDLFFDDELDGFRTLALCEARVYDYHKNFKDNERRFDKAGCKINAYVGNSSNITEEDIIRCLKSNV